MFLQILGNQGTEKKFEKKEEEKLEMLRIQKCYLSIVMFVDPSKSTSVISMKK